MGAEMTVERKGREQKGAGTICAHDIASLGLAPEWGNSRDLLLDRPGAGGGHAGGPMSGSQCS